MSIKGVSGSSGVVGLSGNDAVELSPEGQAEIARLRAEHAQLEGEKILNEEDPFAKLEREHQNALAAQRVIGAKRPLAHLGQGPKAGDPGVGTVAEYVPVALKA